MLKVRGMFLVMLQLRKQSTFSLKTVKQTNFLYRRVTRRLFYRNAEILPSFDRMQNAVSVHPATPDVLNVIKYNPAVDLRHQFKITDVRKRVGLHGGQFHAGFAAILPIIFSSIAIPLGSVMISPIIFIISGNNKGTESYCAAMKSATSSTTDIGKAG